MDDYDESEMMRVAEELSLLSRIADATKTAEPVWTNHDTEQTSESVALLEQVIDTHIASLKYGLSPGLGPAGADHSASEGSDAGAAATASSAGTGGDGNGSDMVLATEVAEKLRTYQVRRWPSLSLFPPLLSRSLFSTLARRYPLSRPRSSARSSPRPKT